MSIPRGGDRIAKKPSLQTWSLNYILSHLTTFPKIIKSLQGIWFAGIIKEPKTGQITATKKIIIWPSLVINI